MLSCCHVMSLQLEMKLVALLHHHDYRQLYVTKNYSCRRYRVRLMFSRLRNSSAFKRALKWSNERLDEPWSPEVERYFVGDWKSRSNAVLKDSGLFVLEIAVIYGAFQVVTQYFINFTFCIGPSMLPTINMSGDFVLIDRVTYSLLDGQYKTGDVVIAVNPYDPLKTVCKRIAAIEGEVILLTKDPSKKSGTSSQGINITRLPEAEQQTLIIPVARRLEPSKAVSSSDKSATDPIAVIQEPSDTPLKSKKQEIEQSSNEKQIRSLEEGVVDGTTAAVESTDVITTPPPEDIENLYYDYFEIPKGHVWLAGDNVVNSTDSRFYGPVPKGLLRGKVCYKVQYYPPFLQPVVSSTEMLYRNGPEYSALFNSRNTFALTKDVLDNLVSDSADIDKITEKKSKKNSRKSGEKVDEISES